MDMVFVKENEALERREDESKICLTSGMSVKDSQAHQSHFVMMKELCHRTQECASGCAFTTRANGRS